MDRRAGPWSDRYRRARASEPRIVGPHHRGQRLWRACIPSQTAKLWRSALAVIGTDSTKKGGACRSGLRGSRSGFWWRLLRGDRDRSARETAGVVTPDKLPVRGQATRKEHPFDSIFAPSAGLERPTGTLTLPVVSMIEDTIYFLRVKGWIHQTERLRHSKSPVYNLALVACVFRTQ